MHSPLQFQGQEDRLGGACLPRAPAAVIRGIWADEHLRGCQPHKDAATPQQLTAARQNKARALQLAVV